MWQRLQKWVERWDGVHEVRDRDGRVWGGVRDSVLGMAGWDRAR